MSQSRLAAILFADLVASTETVARLGPDVGEAWRQRFVSAMREALAATGGREVQHTGDGLFAAFESASDAVACAVAIQQRVARASERRDAPAPAQAYVGVSVGEAREDEEGLHGLVVVEAARLCAAAKPGQILVTSLVEAFASGGPQRFSTVGELELKGLPAPTAVREVLWQEAAAAAIPLSARLAELARRPFVGRAAERAVLERALDAVRSGERRIALLAGEPGIGKTRLTAEFARDAQASGAIVLDGRCDEDVGAPFQPWVQALSHLASRLDPHDLRTLQSEETLHAARLVPELHRGLPDAASGSAPDSDTERWRILEAVDALLCAASRSAPLVVVLDDLHWADPASLVLLRQLARSTRPAALLVVGTYRETDLSRTHPLAAVLADLRREPRVERVLLRGLPEAELGALVAALARESAPEAFVRTLHAETEGNPFFAEEVLRHLVEAGALRREDGRWLADQPLAEIGIPEGVREVVGRRLTRLSSVANQALRAASVIGREFDLRVLEPVADLSRDALLEALDEVTRVQLVTPVPGVSGVYSFAHALIQQTLYEELGAAQRMRLHWRAGEAIERRHARELDAHSAAVAHHFVEGVLAGDPLRAADASLRAAAHATALAGHEDARAHFERALATLDQAGLDEPERRFGAWTGLGFARFHLGQHDEGGDAHLAAFRIAEAQGASGLMVLAAMNVSRLVMAQPSRLREMLHPMRKALAALGADDHASRALLMGRIAHVSNFADAEYDETERQLREAQAEAQLSGDPSVVSEVAGYEGYLLQGTPRVDELERLSRERLDDWSLRGDIFRVGIAMQGLAAALMMRGGREALEGVLSDYERSMERAGSATLIAWAMHHRAAQALAEGRFDRARHIAAQVRELQHGALAGELNFRVQVQAARLEEGRYGQIAPALEAFLANAPRWLQYVRTIRVSILAALGSRDDALRELEAFDALALPRRGWGWPLALRHLAEAVTMLGNAERATDLVTVLEPYAGQLLVAFQGAVIESSADRLRGQLLLLLGRVDEAIACCESGLSLESRFGAPALEARSRYWLARALATRAGVGDRARALEEAHTARDAARAFGMAHLEEQAATLAAQCA